MLKSKQVKYFGQLKTKQMSFYKTFLESITNMIYQLLLFCLICIVCSGYNWTNVKQTVDLFHINGTYPGAVLRVANSTHNLYTYENGYFTKDSHVPFTQQTIFDIASLTKVTATLPSIMKLYEEGKIQLSDLVIKFVPEYNNNNKSSTTIENLLLHNAGLDEDSPDMDHDTKQEIIDFIFNCKLSYPIGTQYLYSDLGFVLLGIIVQRITQTPLDVYAKNIFNQIGLNNTSYLPSPNLKPYIAPTQYSTFRKKVVQGQVHDPTAHNFGGVAGDAGVFSIASDLQKYMQVHLSKGKLSNGTQFYRQQTVEKFRSRVYGLPYINSRALGWDTVPNQQYPPCGHLFSFNSFGHTGYTGTMMWADGSQNLIVILLTNRVNPTSQNKDILKARSAIVDEIVYAYMTQQN